MVLTHIFSNSSSIAVQHKHKHSRTLLLYHPFSMLLGYVLKLQDGIHLCCKPYYRILLAWSMKPFIAKNVSKGKGDEKTNNLIRSFANALKEFPILATT